MCCARGYNLVRPEKRRQAAALQGTDLKADLKVLACGNGTWQILLEEAMNSKKERLGSEQG